MPQPDPKNSDKNAAIIFINESLNSSAFPPPKAYSPDRFFEHYRGYLIVNYRPSSSLRYPAIDRS
jgi:hypothetical protein